MFKLYTRDPHDELDLKYVKVTAIAAEGIQLFQTSRLILNSISLKTLKDYPSINF